MFIEDTNLFNQTSSNQIIIIIKRQVDTLLFHLRISINVIGVIKKQ